MAKHDESELRIVEVKGSLPVQQMRRPVPAMPRRHPAPTRAEALKAVRSMKGAASVIERIPMLGDTTSWNEVAFWSMRDQTGAALGASGGIFVWNCDFMPGFGMVDAYSYAPLHVEGETGAVFFAGPAEPTPLAVEPPAEFLSGQVWCYMDVPVRDFYVFVAQVFTYNSSDPPEENTDYTATFEWGIDTSVLGTVTLPLTSMSGGYNHPFLVELSSGLHRFVIKQVTGAVYFVSLTAWQIPYPIPQMAKHDESELRIVEVKGSLPVQQMRRPVPAMPRRHPAPTRAEALKAVRSMKGAASVIERIPMLGDTTSWNEVAFWSMRDQTGAALGASGGIFVWYCDFTPSFDMGFAYSHPPELGIGIDIGIGEVFFAGADLPVDAGGGVEPPAEPLSGQVWCYMDVPDGPNGMPVSNFYLFVAQVGTSSDQATIEWGIDAPVLGTVALFSGEVLGRVNYPFLVQLSSGLHSFVIKQVTGGLLFQSLTAWLIPYPVVVTGS